MTGGEVFCENCGDRHAAEYSHEGQHGEGPVYAVVCERDWLTDYYTTEALIRRTEVNVTTCDECGRVRRGVTEYAVTRRLPDNGGAGRFYTTNRDLCPRCVERVAGGRYTESMIPTALGNEA